MLLAEGVSDKTITKIKEARERLMMAAATGHSLRQAKRVCRIPTRMVTAICEADHDFFSSFMCEMYKGRKIYGR